MKLFSLISGVVLALSLNVAAQAAPQLSIDGSVSLGNLKAQPGSVIVNVWRDGDTYTVDASSVVHAKAAKYLAAILDFEKYDRIGMAPIVEAHKVQENPLVVWLKGVAAGITSECYIEGTVYDHLGSHGDAMGVSWELVKGKSKWKYPDHPAFTRQDGAYYLEQLSETELYVRYSGVAEVSTSLPSFLIAMFVKRSLKKNVIDGINLLADHANEL
jgi:hypothetical protein